MSDAGLQGGTNNTNDYGGFRSATISSSRAIVRVVELCVAIN